MVYADSLSPISADGFRFTSSSNYPNVLKGFDKSFSTLDALLCDILLKPHPDVSDLWTRVEKRAAGRASDALVDAAACRHFADKAREWLKAHLAAE
jgi:metallo-beta-lactamase class B